MKRVTQDLRIALAVHATAWCAVATAPATLLPRKGQWANVGEEWPSPVKASAPFVLFGGSFAVPFGILALRDTRFGWTVPAISLPTIVAAFISVRMHPSYAIFGVGYLAIVLVRCFAVRVSGEAVQGDGASRLGDGG